MVCAREDGGVRVLLYMAVSWQTQRRMDRETTKSIHAEIEIRIT